MKYIIKKGKHYASGFNFALTTKNTIKFSCVFSKNCLYDKNQLINNDDIYDINKLYGVSLSYHHHHKSARFGWRCIDNKTIQIITYTYNNSLRKIEDSKILGIVKPNEIINLELYILKNKIKYSFINLNSGEKNSEYFNIKNCFPIRYILFPYFGGNNTAPHAMEINIFTYE